MDERRFRTAELPAELNKVEFRGATVVTIADHKAVYLKMTMSSVQEIDDARLMQQDGFHSITRRRVARVIGRIKG